MSKLELLARDGRMSVSVNLIGAQLNNAGADNPARPLACDLPSHYRADNRYALCASLTAPAGIFRLMTHAMPKIILDYKHYLNCS